MEFRPGNGPARPSLRRGLTHQLGSLLLMGGMLLLLVAAYAYFADPSRAEQVLPRPVALASGADTAAPSVATPIAKATPSPTSPATAVPAPVRVAPASKPSEAPPTATPAPKAAPARPAEPPIRMVIRSIYVDTKIHEIGTAWKDGQLIWETVPFIVGHYSTTAMPGQNGNGVYVGHVTSQTLGNVFINLWEINIGDKVEIYTKDNVYTYVVSRVRLVDPADISVMDQTPNATVTLITCAGHWIPSQHQYSKRLIVNATLSSSQLIQTKSNQR